VLNLVQLGKQTLFAVALVALGLESSVHAAQESSSKSPATVYDKDQSTEFRIAALIQQLGSDSYAARKQAESELMQIGILAMDQLQIASLSSDPQIATSALFVQQSIPQNWVWQDDSFQVQQILDGYGSADTVDRASRLDRLALLRNGEGLPALCRIVRYEVSGQLSRLASMRIMRIVAEASDESSLVQRELVAKSLGDSQREPSLWVRQFLSEAETGTFDVDWWRDRAKREHQLLRENSRETRRNVMIDFYEWICQQMAAKGHRAEAIELASAMLELIDAETFRLADACQWAIENGLPELVEHISQTNDKLKARFAEEPQLGYLLAESFQKRSMEPKAQETAKAVFERKRFQGLPTQVERLNVGVELSQRGQFDWAERELTASLDKADLTSRITMVCLEVLSELLGDGEKYEQAADAWKPIVDRIQNEPMFAKQIANDFPGTYDGRIIENVLARYHYLRGQSENAKGNHAAARDELRKAFELYDENVDFLIAMSRVEGDESWKSFTQQNIEKILNRYREQIQAAEIAAVQGGPRDSASVQGELAKFLNESAWLSASTNGNSSEAVAFASKACKLSPGIAAYVDTLARAYFANGQIQKAIDTQQEAIALDPHSRTMKRQLAEFTEALRKSNSGDK
jgi:tetratricopeptide (TPR) repeat protein